MGGRNQLLERLVTLGRQVDRLAAAVARVTFAANEPTRREPGNDLSHGGAVQRNPLSKRALVDVRFAVQRVERRELWRRDVVRDFPAPEHVHDLQCTPHQVARVLHKVLRRVDIFGAWPCLHAFFSLSMGRLEATTR
jgi:hypothetical protein